MAASTRFVVKIPEAYIDGPHWMRYLALLDWHHEKVKDVVDASPTEDFRKFVEKTLNDYLDEKKMPDPEIAPLIMNLADDHLSGRELFLRSGDYYVLQKHFRAGKGKH